MKASGVSPPDAVFDDGLPLAQRLADLVERIKRDTGRDVPVRAQEIITWMLEHKTPALPVPSILGMAGAQLDDSWWLSRDQQEPDAVDLDIEAQFVAEFGGLNLDVIHKIQEADQRYLALIGALDWDVEFDSESELDHCRRSHGIARGGGPVPVYKEEELSLVAENGWGVSRGDVAMFHALQSLYFQALGLG